MAYRFTNTEKWTNDGWFIDLPPNEKLLFIYLCETCDIAGFRELSVRQISFNVGLSEEEIKGALKGLQRGLVYSKDSFVVFVRNFIKHQKNLPLNPKNSVHIGIINRLTENLDKFGFTDINQYFNADGNSKAPLKGSQST